MARMMLQTAKISSHSLMYLSVILRRAELMSRRPTIVSVISPKPGMMWSSTWEVDEDQPLAEYMGV
jgi:hypothetical protein